MDWSTYYAEQRAGVYDDTGEPCADCGHYPCQCDRIFDSWKDREFDDP